MKAFSLHSCSSSAQPSDSAWYSWAQIIVWRGKLGTDDRVGGFAQQPRMSRLSHRFSASRQSPLDQTTSKQTIGWIVLHR